MKLELTPLWPELKKINKALRFGYDSDRILYYEGAKFSSLAIICALSFILLLSSILTHSLERGALLITILILLASLYYKIKISTHGLRLRRQFSKTGREKQTSHVTYLLTVPTGQKEIELQVHDHFSGDKHSDLLFNTSLGQSSISHKHKIELNNGMGVHRFYQLDLQFFDQLGIMQMQTTLEHPESMTVYPKIERMRPQPLTPDLYSFYPGPQEVIKRGDSQIFRAIREYRFGDSYKHINWKKSAKFRKLHTNEYEKCVNSNVKIILDLDQTLHFGSGDRSTWEILKDYAMALASQQLQSSNSIMGITQNGIIGPGRGQTFLNQLEMILPKLGLVDAKKVPILKKASPLLSAGDALFYLTPFIHSKIFYENIKELSHLSFRLENRPTLVLVDALTILWSEYLETGNIGMKALVEISTKNLKQLMADKGKYPFNILVLTIPANKSFSFMSIRGEAPSGR
ncbi:MAG: hypothetical protein A2X86_02430 [Bdellovibrionales bacterium GWA2_49_15]|nr:MAG: hypothetical protein A2X86_02430 [Bdellovibrionales bacterium GWA2_49_15]